MVKILTQAEWESVHKAIQQAQSRLSAKIDIAILPASSGYQGYALMYGLILGSFVALAVWFEGLTKNFPALLCLQIGTLLLCGLLHGKNHFFVRFIPARTQQRYAHQAAMRHYHAIHVHRPEDQPHILFFISVAEHYVHVLTNPVVHKKVPDNWEDITKYFTELMSRTNLCASCVGTIDQIGQKLAPAFPAV